MTTDNWINAISFNDQGLIPAIAQDRVTGKILMMAWMNAASLKQTLETKTAVYYSRSRQTLWHKGETSGHTQIVHDIFLDCDADVLILSITQVGDIACHTGRHSCFYKKLNLDGKTPSWQTVEPVLKDPEDIYHQASSTFKQNNDITANLISASRESVSKEAVTATDVLHHLDAVLAERKQADADSSYVASLYAKGLNKILEKVGEETVETIIAAKDLVQHIDSTHSIDANIADADVTSAHHQLANDLIYEIADVWFHTLVTLAWFNITSDTVLYELARRFGLSGITEKASR